VIAHAWRSGVVAALVALAVIAAVAGDHQVAEAATEEHPRLVLETPDGAVVIRLAPVDAPAHVDALLDGIADGTAERWSVDRIAASFYVQLGSRTATALSGLAPEPGRSIGNVRGAVSVYDGGDADPTLLLVLTDSHQLDDRYTPVGWIESGLDVVERIAAHAADADGVPDEARAVGPLRRLAPGAAADPGATATGRDSVPVASVVAMMLSALCVAAIALAHRRMSPAVTTTVLLAAALVAFFAAWSAVVGRTADSPAAAVLLFATVIALFRLMGRFETPREQQRRSDEPTATSG
jgi:cyclophilin family peptidyl-prolyl cis-trans isomerase